MGWGTGNLGGSSAGLTFKVNAYPDLASLLATVPAENTIGVVTNTPITARVFSSTEPQSMIDGAVWFLTGTNSPAAFNVLKAKKDTVMVYPMSAKQSVDGVLVDVVAKSYIGGKWVDWWNGELFDNGNEYMSITGGWSCTVEGMLDKSDGLLKIKSSDKTPRVYTNNAIDITEFSEIIAKVNIISASTFRFSVTPNQTSGGDYLASVTRNAKGEAELRLDISSGSGYYYVQFAAYVSNVEIKEVRLVR